MNDFDIGLIGISKPAKVKVIASYSCSMKKGEIILDFYINDNFVLIKNTEGEIQGRKMTKGVL